MNAVDSASIRYVFGVDGGGTGTRARLTRRSGETIGTAEAGPSALAQGIEQARTNVLLTIERAFRAADIRDWQPEECAVGLGLAGAIVEQHHRDFIRETPRFGALSLASDGFTTLLGAHEGRAGSVVAAGTGSIGEALF